MTRSVSDRRILDRLRRIATKACRALVARLAPRAAAAPLVWVALALLGAHEAEGQGRGLFRSLDTARVAAAPGPAAGPETHRTRAVQIDVGRLDAVRELAARGAHTPLTLNLFGDVVYSAVIERTAPAFSGGYTLSGPVAEEKTGSVVLVVNGDVVAGSIWTLGGAWEVHPAGPGRHIVEEIDVAGSLGECERLDDSLGTAGHGAVGSVVAARPVVVSSPVVADGSRIDVAAFYTAGAKDDMGGTEGVEAKIESHITATNRILEEGEALPRFHLVYTGETAFRGTRLSSFEPWYESGDGGEAAKAEEVNADVVFVLHDGNRGAAGGSLATASIRSAAVFAHEAGHLLGAEHDRYERCVVKNRCHGDTGSTFGTPPFG